MARMNLVVGISDDLNSVSIEMLMDGNPLGYIYLDRDGVDQHIRSLQKYKQFLGEAPAKRGEPS